MKFQISSSCFPSDVAVIHEIAESRIHYMLEILCETLLTSLGVKKKNVLLFESIGKSCFFFSSFAVFRITGTCWNEF